MNFRAKPHETPEVGLTPLIDVVFLLLIFFMVSTTFRKESDFDIELPEATQQSSLVKKRQLEIVVDVRGHYAVNGRVLDDTSLEVLKSAIQTAVGEDKKLPVVIRADAQTEHQAVVKVMDAAGQLGFHQLGIVTMQAATGQPPAPVSP